MIRIENCNFDTTIAFDLFVFTVNYEERSTYLFDMLSDRLNPENTLLIVTDNYRDFPYARDKIDALSEKTIFNAFPYTKSEDSFVNTIVQAIRKKKATKSPVSVFVDYSSLPRKWYCSMPKHLEKELDDDDIVYFWYSEGQYAGIQERYPTAGTDAYCHSGGQPSLFAESRTHIIGLSYDVIRTRGIIQKTDPDYLILLDAHDHEREDIGRKLADINAEILPQAGMHASLDISDFSYMVNRIKEIVTERLYVDDVILIPDGPKPLILAMSMMPLLINRRGLTCIHVARNMHQFVPIEVKASQKIVGFSFRTISAG